MLASNEVGGRFRKYRTVTPTAAITTASRRKATAATESAGPRVDDVLRLEPPALAPGPRLALPDGNRSLQGVDAEPGRGEGLVAVRRRHGDDNRALADLQDTHPVQQGDAADHRPPHPRLVGHVAQSGNDLLLVGLVLELVDPWSALGMVPGGAGEEDQAPAVGAHGPGGGLGDRERGRRQADPGVALRRRQPGTPTLVARRLHPVHGTQARPLGAVSGPPPRVILRAVPFDDDAEADFFRFRPPPHPDDRLWRHPSELGPERATPPGGQDRQSARPWGVVAVAGTAGAVLAGAGVLAFGLGDRTVDRPVVERVALDTVSSPPRSPDQASNGIRQHVAPAVVS